LGCYIRARGQLSSILKERAFLSSALIALLLGVAFGPIGTGWINPLEWSGGNEATRNKVTFQLCRLVIGIQVLFAGISLPAAYLKTQAQSLVILLLPIMIFAWFITAGLIYALVPGLSYLEALCIVSLPIQSYTPGLN
jgi:NhaP-type Na+/H+ or K+/H+ antiporter